MRTEFPAMLKPTRIFMSLAAVLMAMAVALGAIGSHALASRVPADRLAIWNTAVEYHFFNALGLFAVGFVCQFLPDSKWARYSGYQLAAGIILFSGSLYAYVLSSARWITALAPAGGLVLIAGWVLLAAALLRDR